MTELFSESSEPPFDELPLSEFKKLFPAGKYVFVGETIDGVHMRSKATLTHNFPAGPKVTSPAHGSTVAAGATFVRWNPVTELEIVKYQVVVTREDDPQRLLEADLPSTVTSFRVPPEFMESAQEFKAEVLAIGAGGNQTLTEVTFTTY